MALSKKPVNGMKDILPEEMQIRDYVQQVIKETYRSFGFTPIETPCMENIANLSNKQGGENEKLIFKVMKRGEKLKVAEAKEEGERMQLLTFMLNNVRFGIPVDDVESIETRMSVVGVPNAPAHIEGIVNLHGDIVPICNLADYFGYPKQDIKNVIVASMNGMKIGLEVESVREIIDVNEKQVIPMPTIMNANQSCFNDVASYDKQLIVMFEVSKLMPQSEQQGIKQLIDDNT